QPRQQKSLDSLRRVQLSAGRRDILPAALPNRRGQVTPTESRLKVLDPGPRARPKRRAAERIEEDQVHLGAKWREQLAQPPRVVRRIVHTVEHHVLEHDSPPPLHWQGATGADQLRERITFVD